MCLWLFLDGATVSVATTPIVLYNGRLHPAWQVALAGAVASALGSAVQLLLLRWALGTGRPWMSRFAPSREKLEAALARHPTTSFLALLVARATPLPDAPLKLVAAALEYPVERYSLAVFLGSLPYYFLLAALGEKFRPPLWAIAAVGAVLLLSVLVDRWRRRTT